MNYIFVLLISWLLPGCTSSVFKQTLLSSKTEFTKTLNTDKSEIWHRLLEFESSSEAEDFFLQRRLGLQRLYELSSEPYFGTPRQKDCKNNIDVSGKVQAIGTGKFFYLKMLENENFALGDCLLENNKLKALYEFYLCGKNVYEVRWHREYDLPDLVLPTFRCP